MRAVVQVAAAAILSLAFLMHGSGTILGEDRRISETQHDVAIPGTPVCMYCHIPHATNAEALWASKPNMSGPFSGLRPLCFSCHDGTVTSLGSFAFDLSRPLHLRSPGVVGADCDRCHDPHETGYGDFIRYSGGASFCSNCHQEAGPTDHPIDVDVHVLGTSPLDSSWDPDAGDIQGTRLWNAEGSGPGDYVKCLSCHAPHGGLPDTKMNTMGISGSHEEFLPLCQNCHYRWSAP